MKKTIALTLLATLIVLAQSGVAPAPSSPANVSTFNDTISFLDVPLNLTSLNATTELELDACYATVNDSNILNGAATLAAAFERVYSDGSKEYHMYIDTVDDQDNIHEYESVVAVEGNEEIYRIISNQQVPLGLNLNASSVSDSTSDPNSSKATVSTPSTPVPAPATLSAFINTLSAGETQLTPAQISADTNLPNIEKALSKDFPVIGSASIAAIYSKVQGLSTAYVIFYSSTSNKLISLWSAYVVADNLKKKVYIVAFNSIAVPTSVKGN